MPRLLLTGLYAARIASARYARWCMFLIEIIMYGQPCRDIHSRAMLEDHSSLKVVRVSFQDEAFWSVYSMTSKVARRTWNLRFIDNPHDQFFANMRVSWMRIESSTFVNICYDHALWTLAAGRVRRATMSSAGQLRDGRVWDHGDWRRRSWCKVGEVLTCVLALRLLEVFYDLCARSSIVRGIFSAAY